MDEKPKTWAVSLQDVVSVHVMTSLPIDVRFPDCDFLVRLDPPRRWKRGQKLNRGGRRRARAKHSARAKQDHFLAQINSAFAATQACAPATFAPLEHYKPWAQKTAKEILEDLRDFAAKFTSGYSTRKDGDQ